MTNEPRSKWAAISGSIETSDTNPLAAAYREINEETSLKEADVTLLRAGKPYTVTDTALDTEWQVNPFAFTLATGAAERITLNPEHSEYRFVRTEELAGGEFDTVPDLFKGLERCVVGPIVAKGLAELRDDHVNGARVLAIRALETLVKAVERGEIGKKGFWSAIRMAGWHLSKNGRPSMAAAIEAGILRTLTRARKEWDDKAQKADLKEIVVKVGKQEIAAREHSIDALCQHFVQYLSQVQKERIGNDGGEALNILTLSSSSTLLKAITQLLQMTNIKINLRILESRPLFEGVTFAQNLLSSISDHTSETPNNRPKIFSMVSPKTAGHLAQAAHSKAEHVKERLRIEIASDASAGLMAGKSDVLVLGADRISKDGDVKNKTGSLAAACLLKRNVRKGLVVAVAETDKIAMDGPDETEEDNDPAEVTTGWPGSSEEKESLIKSANVKVKNVYFEWVPKDLVDVYVTETRVLGVDGIRGIAHERVEEEERIFGDL